MRLVCFVNNWTGWQALRWLRERGEEIAGVVMHPPDARRCGERIVEAAGGGTGQSAPPILDGSRLGDPHVQEQLAALRPDMGLCVFFGYLLPPAVLRLFPRGCYNLHPSLLPYNRGGYPNVWSIVEGTPAGVTLHRIDEGVDSGPVVARREVRVEPVDTGATLYRRLERACVQLLRESWPAVREGTAPHHEQEHERATVHRDCDVEQIDRIDLDRTYRARELIDLLRARTFPPHSGAYFEHDGRRVGLRLTLEYIDSAEAER